MMRTVWMGLVVMSIAAAPAMAEQWPTWRGPRGDGTSLEKNVPVTWSARDNITWKVRIPGKGHSSPVVWDDRIYVTTCEGKQRMLLAVDRRGGKIVWNRVVLTAELEYIQRLNSHASGTPVTDGKHVWVTFLDVDKIRVVCCDASGKEVWRATPGRFTAAHGFCTTLLLHDNKLIVNGDQDAKGDDRAYIVALDKTTGKELWRVDRPNRVRSYTPPVVYQAGGKWQMVLSGSKCVASYDPRTGKRHWIVDGPTEQFVASLVYGQGLFMMTGGFPTLHLMGIRPDGEGNVTRTHVSWHIRASRKTASYVPSPIVAGEYFFVVSDFGPASCLEAKTGKLMWRETLGRHHSASPVSANGLLYFPDDDGVTHVLKASPKFEVVAKNALGEKCFASPAVSGGQIFLRALYNLYCIGPVAADKNRP